MTKTTYEILNDKINNIGKELCKIGKENNLHRLFFVQLFAEFGE